MFIFSHSVSFNPSFVIISFFYDLDKIRYCWCIWKIIIYIYLPFDLNKQIKSVDFLLAWYSPNLPNLVWSQNNTTFLLVRRRKISQIVPRTKNENVTTSASYEHVKYHKFCIVRKGQISQILHSTNIQISQIVPRTKNENVTTSASYESVKYHKFCIVPKIRILFLLFVYFIPRMWIYKQWY
jgi:hypothetical protein